LAAQGRRSRLCTRAIEVGRRVHGGQGVAKDSRIAVDWYRKAADQGDSDGQYKLAVLLDQGEAVEKDSTRALDLLKKSASQGNVEAKERVHEVEAALSQIKITVKRIASTRETVANQENQKKLDEIASKLASASEATDYNSLMQFQHESDAAIRIFDEAEEFKQVAVVADHRVADINAELAKIDFDAPLIRDIKAAVNAVNSARADGGLAALKDTLAKLNQVYSEDKLHQLQDAKAHGFDSVEEYDDFKNSSAKLSRAGIHLNPK
jgi:TPR repeat protein